MKKVRIPQTAAYTLIEIVVAISIVIVLLALMFPIFISIRNKGHETACVSNLSQLGKAIELYRQDIAPNASSGWAEDIGLPPRLAALKSYGFDPQVLRCQGLSRNASMVGHGVYQQMYSLRTLEGPRTGWLPYSLKHGENSVIVIDVNHRLPSTPLDSPHFDHFGIGLYLTGNVKTFRKKGSWHRHEWWSSL